MGNITDEERATFRHIGLTDEHIDELAALGRDEVEKQLKAWDKHAKEMTISDDELRRRVAAVEAGEVELLSLDEVLTQLRAEFNLND